MDNTRSYGDELRRQWAKVAHFEDGAIQLAIEHPLAWFVRRTAILRNASGKSLVIVSENPIENLRSSKCIETSCDQRRDGRYAISFTLTDAKQEDVFFAMAVDLIVFSQVAQTPKEAINRVRKRYAAWQRLLDRGHAAVLSKVAQKGLFAELAFLKEVLERGMPPTTAIAGWVGPEAADQDFIYEDGWHEVKATGVASAAVTISSIEQLDCEDEGELVVCRIDACAPAHPGAETLRYLVEAVHTMLLDSTEATTAYEGKLADVGYLDREEYDETYYYLARMERYHVNDAFPRLRRADVPHEILNASYQLDLPGLASWKK